MLGSIKQEPTDERIEQREKRKQRSQAPHDIMKNREEIKVFGIAIHGGLRPACLFRLDPATDQLLQHIQRDAAVTQDHFVELSDIKSIA